MRIWGSTVVPALVASPVGDISRPAKLKTFTGRSEPRRRSSSRRWRASRATKSLGEHPTLWPSSRGRSTVPTSFPMPTGQWTQVERGSKNPEAKDYAPGLLVRPDLPLDESRCPAPRPHFLVRQPPTSAQDRSRHSRLGSSARASAGRWAAAHVDNADGRPNPTP